MNLFFSQRDFKVIPSTFKPDVKWSSEFSLEFSDNNLKCLRSVNPWNIYFVWINVGLLLAFQNHQQIKPLGWGGCVHWQLQTTVPYTEEKKSENVKLLMQDQSFGLHEPDLWPELEKKQLHHSANSTFIRKFPTNISKWFSPTTKL